MITIQQAQQSKEHFDRFIEENTGLVGSVIRRSYNFFPDKEDYYQIGCIGLIKAVKQFNPDFKVEFSTYAIPKIVGEISRYRRDNENTIHVRRQIKSLYYKVRRLRDENKSDEEICTLLKTTPEDIWEAESTMCPVASLNDIATENKDGKALTIEEVTPSGIDIENSTIENIEWQQKLDILKRCLSERNLYILRLHLKGKKQGEIGRIVGVKQVQVSRILNHIAELGKQISRDYNMGITGKYPRFGYGDRKERLIGA
jgi:RNA polymerase sporulation-specific sigma factor